MNTTQTLHFGCTEVDLIAEGDRWIGLGAVRAPAGTLLRSPQRPMAPALRNPFGVALLNWRVEGTRCGPGDRHVIDLGCDRLDGGPMEFMLHTVRPRWNTADWSLGCRPATGTRLSLELWPVERVLGGRRFAGFGYQYRYESPDIPQYKILDQATWEIGGNAIGNEIWLRGAEPSIHPVKSLGDYYSSEWYLPGIANPNIFQFKPLQTHLQGFTFTAAAQGILVTWTPAMHHVRTLIQKDRGSDRIVHLHEHCADLGSTLASAPMEVLFWSRGGTDRIDRANAYEDVRELVHATLHERAGLARERIGVSGMIEEWGAADLRDYAERGLPKLLAAGVRTVDLANHFENNMNTYGVDNMCCTVDLRVAESVGEDNLRNFCRIAARGGAAVRMWGNTSLSTISSLLLGESPDSADLPSRIRLRPAADSPAQTVFRTPQAWVRDPSGSIEADHYRPRFAVMNLRDPGVRKYWLDAWRHAVESIGLGGIFLDSSFNLSSDKFHWWQDERARSGGGATADQAHLLVHQRPSAAPTATIQSLYLAHLEVVAEMQRMGCRYCGEDQGVFGVHRTGWNIPTNLNALFLWADCLQNFDVPLLREIGANPDDVFFKALAYRAVWMLHWNPRHDCLSFHQYQFRGDFDAPTEYHLGLLRAFDAVEARMRRRVILPGEAGVRYEAPDGSLVLWTFQDLELPVSGEVGVRDVVGNRSWTARGTLSLKKHQVIVVDRAAALS